MTKTNVAVLRGGPSNEYEVSLESGKAVLNYLPQEKYTVKDVLIDRNGVWHYQGRPREPRDVLEQSDVVFLALHGTYGEDGGVQRLLEHFGIPFTGSRALESAIGMNKVRTKELMAPHGVVGSNHVVLEVGEDVVDRLKQIANSTSGPWVTKPHASGSSVGVSMCRAYDDLVRGFGSALEHSSSVMVEDAIPGREATCAVIENFRGEDLYTPFPIEIVPRGTSNFFDYNAKYKGESDEICPGRFSSKESKELQRLAKLVHEKMNLRHYSRSDFIIGEDGNIYFLEVNTLPGLTSQSLLPKSVAAVGSSLPEFLDHVVQLALR